MDSHHTDETQDGPRIMAHHDAEKPVAMARGQRPMGGREPGGELPAAVAAMRPNPALPREWLYAVPSGSLTISIASSFLCHCEEVSLYTETELTLHGGPHT